MSRLTRDGTAEPVSRDQILRRVRVQGNTHSPFSADHEQNWQPYPVGPYPARCDDHIQSVYIAHVNCTNISILLYNSIVGVGKEGRTKLGPLGFLSRQHPLLELP